MRRLVAVEFLSVDGVTQGLGSPDEDRDGGFEHGGWGVPYGDALHEVIDPSGIGRTTAYLFGRRTYEKLAAYWPSRSDANPMAASLNAKPKYVATRTLAAPLGWKGAEPLRGDLATAVARLKKAEDGGDVVVLGSGVVLRQLMEADLVDELRLFVHPLLLGTGKRLFGELPAPRPLRLIASGATSRGTVAFTYAVEGRRPVSASE